jgi:hypothetical protein
MVKQVLLRVTAVPAKIRFRKLAQLQFGDFSVPPKILSFQNSSYPHVDRK